MRRLEANYEVRAVYRYFPLHPETPEEGRALEDLFRGRERVFAESQDRLAELMRLEGLPYGNRTHTYNSRLAQELAVWADGIGATDALHDALYRAYFVEGLNLAEIEVLTDAAARSGLDADDARAALEERRFSDAVDVQWREALQLGVTGVPTFVAGGYGVVGAQPYETLEALMGRVGIAPRLDTP